ncbi:hypothetical protein D4740_05155 [Actinomyces sp. 2119]|nr:hypothetical protein D4740_05155 [Actinomyces sp. 2119]
MADDAYDRAQMGRLIRLVAVNAGLGAPSTSAVLAERLTEASVHRPQGPAGDAVGLRCQRGLRGVLGAQAASEHREVPLGDRGERASAQMARRLLALLVLLPGQWLAGPWGWPGGRLDGCLRSTGS